MIVGDQKTTVLVAIARGGAMLAAVCIAIVFTWYATETYAMVLEKTGSESVGVIELKSIHLSDAEKDGWRGFLARSILENGGLVYTIPTEIRGPLPSCDGLIAGCAFLQYGNRLLYAWNFSTISVHSDGTIQIPSPNWVVGFLTPIIAAVIGIALGVKNWKGGKLLSIAMIFGILIWLWGAAPSPTITTIVLGGAIGGSFALIARIWIDNSYPHGFEIGDPILFNLIISFLVIIPLSLILSHPGVILNIKLPLSLMTGEGIAQLIIHHFISVSDV